MSAFWRRLLRKMENLFQGLRSGEHLAIGLSVPFTVQLFQINCPSGCFRCLDGAGDLLERGMLRVGLAHSVRKREYATEFL